MSKKLFGWITGDYEFINTGGFYHLEFLKTKGKDYLLKVCPNYYEWMKDIEDCRIGCEELEKDSGWGEWHNLEILEDDTRSNIISSLFAHNWLRVGTIPNSCELEFDGYPETIRSRKQYLEDFAESHNMIARFRPIKERA